jgi:fimbrial chaperone protein
MNHKSESPLTFKVGINIMKLVICTLLMLFSLHTVASLLVTPSRIAFDARDRSKEVILVNTSNQVRSYKLEWVNQRQNEKGEYVKLADEELEAFGGAEQYLRFSPRRVTLQAGESQKVKLMARRRGNMPLPEYRSHLKFIALPPDLVNKTNEDSVGEGISMKLHLLLSYTIPVILRTESPSAKVSISNMTFADIATNRQVLSFQMDKTKATSVYGNFTVYHLLNGNEKAVGFLNGVNFFHEQEKVQMQIPMHNKLTSVSGELKIVYQGTGEFADIIIDENSIAL